MKKLAIYFSSPGAMDYPFSKPMFFESYCEMIDRLEEQGIEVAVVRASAYKGQGEWSPWFKKIGHDFLEQNSVFKSDLIWNKDDMNTIPVIGDCAILNNNDFDEICRDKLKSAELFKEVSGKTILLNSYEDFKRYVLQVPGEKVVLKPRFGERAAGVFVLNKAEIKADLYANWKDILLQEFLDSSGGIPGMVEGIHEIQIFMVNGEFAGARIKEYPEGVFVASITGRGIRATTFRIGNSELPPELWDKVEELDGKLTRFDPRLYRADFVNTPNGYRMIEINSRPGIGHPEKDGSGYWFFNGKIVQVICDFLANHP